MPELTVKEFISVLQRSELLPKQKLANALSQLNVSRNVPKNATDLAHALQQAGQITAWQQENLLQGKTLGYFLGGYKLLGQIGSGGMSTVFLAQHPLLDRQVAIKVLPASRAADSLFVERFLREARAMSRLGHPNVARVFDIDQQDDTNFMIMEYVSGQDLKAIVKRQGPLPLEKSAHYIAQAAAGLQHAHERGLVHRDIKPANLIVSDNEVVKILDLGLARLEHDDEAAELTVAASMMGTADYLAPEQAQDAHTVDHRADIYSLGCTFYYLLTGHAPFTQGSIPQRIRQHQTEKPADVRAERPDCPHAIANVCMTMLEKAPSDRFEQAGLVAQQLHRWLVTQGYQVSADLATYEETPLRADTFGEPDSKIAPARHASANNLPSKAATVASASTSTPSVRRRRTPAALWIALGTLSLVLAGLVIYVVTQQG